MEYRVGIVLSGGGSRGLAHAGVLQALVENGIEPECVSGTSSGAIVGALYAAGCSPAEILAFFDHINPFRLSRLALRKPGLIDTEKVIVDFDRYFPVVTFGELRRKLFVSATDLVHAELEVFTSGPLVRALVASCSVPGVFSPTPIDGRLFVDGGILDNFPVEPLLGLCDVILGVYASPLREVRQPEMRSSISITERALEVGMFHASRRKFHQASLVLLPRGLAAYDLFDTKRHFAIVELGYAAAMDRMEEIVGLVKGDP